jgi:hypothetical protein
VKHHEGEKLIAVIRELMAESAPRCDHKFDGGGKCTKCGAHQIQAPARGGTGEQIRSEAVAGEAGAQNFEALYQRVKARLLEDLRVDPIFVRLLAAQPEIMLEIEPRRVALDASSLKGRICRLVADGFLDAPKKQADINRELGRTGAIAHTGRLSEAVSQLKIEGILTEESDGYRRAPGVKVTRGELVAEG